MFSNFAVHSASGMHYEVEIRDLTQRRFVCTCTDFRINGLGTCKHVEAVLMHVEHVGKSAYRQALRQGSGRVDIVPDRERDALQIERNKDLLAIKIRRQFDADGVLSHPDIENTLNKLRQSVPPEVRFSVEIASWLESRRLARERKKLRRDYELGVQSGLHPAQETLVPLFPYQREGMLYLAFNERALLADEMGLGKTIQAIAACSLLHRLADPCALFAERAASLLGKNLAACEERYPEEAPHTVLVAIVERDAAQWKPRIEQLHAELFSTQDPLFPVRLEVLDRATVETMQRLAEAGIVQITHRATRHLYPMDNARSPLGAEELARVQACRERAARKLKMARLLQAEKMDEEAREALLAAVLETGRALAIESRLPEPPNPVAALAPPLSHAWGNAHATLAAILSDSSVPIIQALVLLENC